VYRLWLKAFPREIDVCAVQLPGRETRLREEPWRAMPELVPDLARGLSSYLDLPFVFFGHSMGALIGFELTRHLRRRGGPLPLHLFVSGCRAPQLGPNHDHRHRCSDAELREELRKLGGTPAEVLEDGEFIQWYLPMLRADFEVCETYQYVPEAPLDCSITALHGERDEEVTYEEARKWSTETRRAFSLLTFPGEHLFIQTERKPVVSAVTEQLAVLMRALP
jgi:medium-chain acyl-[acyl-carrier-protein] hydrolase